MRIASLTLFSASLALSLAACGDKEDETADTGSTTDGADGTGTDGTDGTDGTEPIDTDGDGFSVEEDCDDTNADINPGAEEICDGLDNNCDGTADEGVQTTFYGDADGDGFAGDTLSIEACEAPAGFYDEATDCNDLDAATNPEASEVCDGADNDCDELVDDDDDSLDTSTQSAFYTDADTDGYGDDATAMMACSAASGQVAVGGDCDDGSSDVNPETVWYLDVDSDGYGLATATTQSCEQPSGYVADGTDCDETNAAINPGAAEICDPDDVDENCNGSADDADSTIDMTSYLTFYADSDSDGYGDADTTLERCDAPSGYTDDATDCDDDETAVNPGAAEVCDDGVDNDCSGDAPECGLNGTYDADADADVTLSGTNSSDYTGTAVAAADLNGDGYDDLIVSAYGNDDGANTAGKIGVFAGPVTASADLDSASASWTSGTTTDGIGLDLAEAGDLDGDGYDDLLVGAYGGSSRYGTSYVVYGGTSLASDWATAASASYTNDSGTYDYGYAVAGLGDLDGDGYDDWAQGVYSFDEESYNGGLVYILMGSATAASGAAATSDEATLAFYGEDYSAELGDRGGGSTMGSSDLDGDGNLDLVLGAHNGANSYYGGAYIYYDVGALTAGTVLGTSDADASLVGTGSYNDFGFLVMGRVDFDDDGYEDVLITEFDSDSGTAYIFYGSTTQLSGSASAPDAAGSTISSTQQYDDFGSYGALGDMNGDGNTDILLTAPYYEPSTASSYSYGAAFTFLGPVTQGSTWTDADASAAVIGTDSYDYLGNGQVALGDHNADGNEDLIVSERYEDSYSGQVFLFNQSGM